MAVNLRFPVDARALPFGANAFGIVTAHNPLGRRVPARENEERHRRLAARLADLGWRHVRATGRSADGHHAEPGFAVVAARPDLLAVAEAFGQTAIFWFDGDRFWLWPVRGDPMPLPSE